MIFVCQISHSLKCAELEIYTFAKYLHVTLSLLHFVLLSINFSFLLVTGHPVRDKSVGPTLSVRSKFNFPIVGACGKQVILFAGNLLVRGGECFNLGDVLVLVGVFCTSGPPY